MARGCSRNEPQQLASSALVLHSPIPQPIIRELSFIDSFCSAVETGVELWSRAEVSRFMP